jgi:protein-S-isoprenylcysteine O-methyltransferase Ste14
MAIMVSATIPVQYRLRTLDHRMPPHNPKSPSQMTNAEIKAFLVALVVICGLISSQFVYRIIKHPTAMSTWVVGGGVLLGLLVVAACASRGMIRELLRRRRNSK